MFTHIPIPTDGSKLAGEAVDKGLAPAKAAGACYLPDGGGALHVFNVDAAQLESTPVDY